MPPVTFKNLDALNVFVGREIATTDWFEITQERIRQFAEATEDRQWIHLDPDRAQRESPFAATIAHGFLTLSLLSHLSQQAFQIQEGVGMIINYGLNRVRFPAPVHAGSRIRASFVLQSLKDAGNAREAIFSVVVEGQNRQGQAQAKPCCVAEWVIRYYR
ncbi:MAG: MaoC family dehydratase [Acidobacteriia bacterium]|nr:MaoC family dehydratase [Terriglobia bacterium]